MKDTIQIAKFLYWYLLSFCRRCLQTNKDFLKVASLKILEFENDVVKNMGINHFEWEAREWLLFLQEPRTSKHLDAKTYTELMTRFKLRVKGWEFKKVAFEGLGLPPSKVHIIQGQTETLSPSDLPIPPEGFSGIFFSPPYYDRERYYGDSQSHRLYATYEEWKEKFYRPLFALCFALLTKPPTRMAVVVSDQTVSRVYYPLVMDTIMLATQVGFRMESYRFLSIHGARSVRHIKKDSSEVLLIFSK